MSNADKNTAADSFFTVYSAEGRPLSGTPSKQLVEESYATLDGTVGAYLDDAAVWQFVEPSMESLLVLRGEMVRTVFVQ